MKRTPCEYVMWNGLPVIRKEIAESMITNFGLNQKEAAEKLGITPAAVCQYLSNKRGKITIEDEDLLKEIDISAERILNKTDANVVEETCRICRLLMQKGLLPAACNACPQEK
jgi:predicted transcriptional regulator